MASSFVGGLSGAFIPVSEEAGMIRAVEAGAISLEKLEAMTAVCSVGLDMVAVPGDTPVETIAAIIADEAAIGMINDNISPYATDPNNPAIVLPATDGDNAWGGGSSSWMESTPAFFNDCQNAGYAPTAIQDFVNQYSNSATPINPTAISRSSKRAFVRVRSFTRSC